MYEEIEIKTSELKPDDIVEDPTDAVGIRIVQVEPTECDVHLKITYDHPAGRGFYLNHKDDLWIKY